MSLDSGLEPDIAALGIWQMCRNFSEGSPHPTLVADGPDAIIHYANPVFCKLLGKFSSDLIGHSVCSIVPQADRNACKQLLERVGSTGKAEILTTEDQGDSRFWSYSVWTVTGRPGAVIIQVVDASEIGIFRKRSLAMNRSLLVASLKQHELTELSDSLTLKWKAAVVAKNQFLATMSHEIRTPLNAIVGFAELLSLPGQTNDDRRTFSERLHRHALQLLRLVDDILDLSKIEASKLEIERIKVNLPQLLSDLQLDMAQLAAEKGIQFSMTSLSAIPESIVSDPTRLRQIFTNIISNAIKFTLKGSVAITVEAIESSKKLTMIVKDSWVGMTAEQIPNLFQAFMQGDNTITRKFGGTGLGLDLARRLAQALGGNVTILESTPGLGSSFEITVALEGAIYQDLSRTVDQEKLMETPIRLDGIRVLFADDAPDNRFLVSRYLTLSGASVDTANDGEEAVRMALSHPYDIILMDIQMPKLDGYEATAELRRRGCDELVIALTAHAMPQEIERCRLAGCDAHLAKPFTRLELVGLIDRLWNEEGDSHEARAFSARRTPLFFDRHPLTPGP